MTEHNHKRGTRGRHDTSWDSLPVGQGKEWQRIAHSKRRALVRELLAHEEYDDIPENTPDHIRWDYW